MRQKKKGLKSINETFDSARSGKKGILTIWGRKLPCYTLTFEHLHMEIALSAL